MNVYGWDLMINDSRLAGYLLDGSRLDINISRSASFTGSLNLINVPEPGTLALFGVDCSARSSRGVRRSPRVSPASRSSPLTIHRPSGRSDDGSGDVRPSRARAAPRASRIHRGRRVALGLKGEHSLGHADAVLPPHLGIAADPGERRGRGAPRPREILRRAGARRADQYEHDDEGPDDMPAHLKTALTQVQLISGHAGQADARDLAGHLSFRAPRRGAAPRDRVAPDGGMTMTNRRTFMRGAGALAATLPFAQ